MDYLQVTEEFLMKYPDYRHDVMNFNEYLEMQWKNSLSDDAIRFWLQGLDVDFLLSSLIYNIEEKKRYKSKTTAKRYATVIGQLFHFIRKRTDVENIKLYNAISYNSSRENAYMKRMISYINQCSQLSGIVELEALRQRDALSILEWADEQLGHRETWKNGEKVNSTALKKAMAAIGVKMMLLYGITYRELRKVRISQYNDLRNTMELNGFELRLPYNLAIQIKYMKNFLEANSIFNAEGLFFIIDESGQPWGEITSSSGIPDYLGPLIGNTSVTSIVKYGISQLLKVGLNDSIIKRITGASDKLISGCIDQNDEEMVNIINNKLVTVDLYYEF